MNERPKLLFLAYAFPPLQNIACVRTWNIAKYLSKMDWDVKVVTPSPSFHPVLEKSGSMESDMRKMGVRPILTGHGWRMLLRNYWPGTMGSLATRACRRLASSVGVEHAFGWMKAIDQACSTLRSNDVDVILATGPPYGAFRQAARLASRLNRPYVLDYRDPWTGYPYATQRFQRAVRREEQDLLRGATAVTVTSPSWASGLERRFNVGSKVHVVTNGYDPEDLANVKAQNFDHHAIVYTGIFYPPKRVVTPLMTALGKLKQLTKHDALPWRFHYFGSDTKHVRQEAERFGVMDRVELHGSVSRTAALSAVRGASVAVIITSVYESGSQDDMGMVPGKLFEPLGLGTPVLLIAPPASDARAIVSGYVARCVTGTDIESAARYLRELMRTKPGRLSISSDAHCWPILAKRFDAILKSVFGRSPSKSTGQTMMSLTAPTDSQEGANLGARL